MEYKPSKKEFVVSIVVAVLGLSVFVGFGAVTYTKVYNVEKEISKINDIEGGLQNAVNAKKYISDASIDIITLDSFFVKSGEEAYFLNDLEKIAKSGNVKIATDTIGVNNTDGGADFKETLNIKIRYEGSWSNVIRFLKSVQSMSKAVVLDSVRLDYKNSEAGLWGGTASLTVYKLK
jgi:hypothetical protein